MNGKVDADRGAVILSFDGPQRLLKLDADEAEALALLLRRAAEVAEAQLTVRRGLTFDLRVRARPAKGVVQVLISPATDALPLSPDPARWLAKELEHGANVLRGGQVARIEVPEFQSFWK